MKILEIKELLAQDNVNIEILTTLATDERKNVQNLLKSYYKRQEKIQNAALRQQ